MERPKTYEEALLRDAERFWSRVDKSNGLTGCWTWKGVRQKRSGRGNYNPVRFNGKYVRENRATVAAHVWAYILTFGNRPLGHGLKRGSSGLVLMHTCENGNLGCVNPHHLQIGTQADNMRRCRQLGRGPDQKLKRIEAELQRLVAELVETRQR